MRRWLSSLLLLCFLVAPVAALDYGGGAGSGASTITGGTCTNQFVRSLDTAGLPTCAAVVTTDLSLTQVTLGTSGILVGGTNTVEQYNTTNGQTFNVYNTRTDASNGEWGFNKWVSNEFRFGATANGSGTVRNIGLDTGGTLTIRNGGTSRNTITVGSAGSALLMFGQTASTGTSTSGTAQVIYGFAGTFAPASGTPPNYFMNLTPIINWTTPAAGNYIAERIAVTETSVPTGTNWLWQANAGSAGTTFKAGITTNPWHVLAEAAADPATTNLTTLAAYATYMKNDKFVIAYNNGGTMTYISIAMNGSATTWVHSTSAP